MSLIVPAVLPTSGADLDEKLALVEHLPKVTRVQIDVVDGKFATPASWPFTAPTELAERAARGEMLPSLDRIVYEIDLMCLDAERVAEPWVALGASRLTFHAESTLDLYRLLESARTFYGCGVIDCGLMALGLALNVESDLALIEPHLANIDYVQLMGIAKIGRQGQPFDPRVFENIRAFRSRHPDIPLQVDGGVSLDTAPKLAALGVLDLIVGSGILRAPDPSAEIGKFAALQGRETLY